MSCVLINHIMQGYCEFMTVMLHSHRFRCSCVRLVAILWLLWKGCSLTDDNFSLDLSLPRIERFTQSHKSTRQTLQTWGIHGRSFVQQTKFNATVTVTYRALGNMAERARFSSVIWTAIKLGRASGNVSPGGNWWESSKFSARYCYWNHVKTSILL